MVKLKATNLKTGEERLFTLNELYGYEGEKEGVFLEGKEEEESWQINFNSGYKKGGMNLNFKIESIL